MSYTGSFTSLVENIVPEVRDGRGWAMVETFRSLCLQGWPRICRPSINNDRILAQACPMSEYLPQKTKKLFMHMQRLFLCSLPYSRSLLRNRFHNRPVSLTLQSSISYESCGDGSNAYCGELLY